MSSYALVIDVSNQWIAVGLCGANLRLEKNRRAPREASNRLVPLIGELLQEAGVKKPDWIVCARGPGSFTGVRIGVCAARTLAQFWEIPVFGVDSLAFYAYAAFRALEEDPEKIPDRIGVMIDGKQKRVYARFFQPGADPVEQFSSESLDIPPAVFIEQHESAVEKNGPSRIQSPPRYFADEPDIVRSYFREGDSIPEILSLPVPRASVLYELALLVKGKERAGDWADLLPEYLREDPARSKFPHGYKAS